MTTYSMGQYRFSSSANTVKSLGANLSYEMVAVTDQIDGSEANTVSLQDVAISREDGEPFEAGKDYCAYLQIPRDMNYNIELTLRLIKDSKEEASNFQYIRKINVPQGGSGTQNVYTVALYEYEKNNVKAVIPENIPFNQDNDYNEEADKDVISADKLNQDKVKKDMLYQYKKLKDNEDGTKSTIATYFYLGIEENDIKYLKRTHNVNDIIMSASWLITESNETATYVLSFRPVEAGFTKLLLKMTRIVEDYNIERVGNDGNVEYGRKLDITKMNGCKLYQIHNLMNKDNIPHTSLTKIGIWGHPELMMIINGEEIKIGPSGYYELDAIPITSLGVVALNNKDMFSIDYQYAID